MKSRRLKRSESGKQRKTKKGGALTPHDMAILRDEYTSAQHPNVFQLRDFIEKHNLGCSMREAMIFLRDTIYNGPLRAVDQVPPERIAEAGALARSMLTPVRNLRWDGNDWRLMGDNI